MTWHHNDHHHHVHNHHHRSPSSSKTWCPPPPSWSSPVPLASTARWTSSSAERNLPNSYWTNTFLFLRKYTLHKYFIKYFKTSIFDMPVSTLSVPKLWVKVKSLILEKNWKIHQSMVDICFIVNICWCNMPCRSQAAQTIEYSNLLREFLLDILG